MSQTSVLDDFVDEFICDAQKVSMTPEEVEEMVENVFSSSTHSPRRDKPATCGRSRYPILVFVLLITSITLTAMTERGRRFILSYAQDLVYPGMRVIRLLSLPFISRFHLSQYHEQECLADNPLYRDPPIECWPCHRVNTILDLTGLTNFTDNYYNGGVPFLLQDGLYREVTYGVLHALYSDYPDLLSEGTARIITNQSDITSLSHVFHSKSILDRRDLHVEWHPRRVPANRVLRTVFPRPPLVPANSEVSLDKIIFIDGPLSLPYHIPEPEFANVFLLQGSGSRTIALVPVAACQHECRHVMVTLQPRNLLFYNWQYWRALSMPLESGGDVSVTYVGSFY